MSGTNSGAPGAAAAFKKLYEQHGKFSIADLGREYEPFYGPINKKLAKYSGNLAPPQFAW